VLEHYKFKETFIRGNKKVFISFLPREVIENVARQEGFTQSQIDNAFEDVGLKMRFSDVREYFATYMTKHLNPAEIDFLQGRVSGSVFMRNYFNPALIGDLKERVFKGIQEITQGANKA
jgi:intergrase/recombinase